jgi:peptide-methionine (S)-S-oxide reductase
MKKLKPFLVIAFPFLILFLCGFSKLEKKTASTTVIKPVAEKNTSQKEELKIAYFASGCFWCVEAIFESVAGVEEAVSGYAGGFTRNPTYRSIGTGTTGHSETVAVYYNPKKVRFKTLVKVFFGSHDPTTKNGQYPDYGSQYRSIAFYKTKEEKASINTFIKELKETENTGEIVTEVTELITFYKAEGYHQNYERLHPNNPYIKNVSVPRLKRFKKRFPELLKKQVTH